MNKILIYIKYSTIFIIIELLISFIISLFNIIGISYGITQLIILISNIILFFILNYLNAQNWKKNGYLKGILLGSIFIVIMLILKFLFLNKEINITTIIYYIILLSVSMFGGMIGVNKKSNK